MSDAVTVATLEDLFAALRNWGAEFHEVERIYSSSADPVRFLDGMERIEGTPYPVYRSVYVLKTRFLEPGEGLVELTGPRYLRFRYPSSELPDDSPL